MKKYVFTFLFSFLLCQSAHPLSELTAGDCSQKQMIFSVRVRNKIGILPQPLRPGPLLLNAAAMFDISGLAIITHSKFISHDVRFPSFLCSSM